MKAPALTKALHKIIEQAVETNQKIKAGVANRGQLNKLSRRSVARLVKVGYSPDLAELHVRLALKQADIIA